MQIRVSRQGRHLTLEEYLQRRIPAAPASYLRQLCKSGKIVRNGVPIKPEEELRSGQILILPDSRRLQEFIAQAPALEILRETERMLVLDKPAGIAVHRTDRNEPDLTSLLQELIRRRKDPYRVSPVTRLDRGTSGLLIFAKGKQAAAELGRQVMDRAWRKTYLALVKGHPPATGTLEQPVLAKEKQKAALTRYRRLHCDHGFALLEIDLQTGRTHQIRQHFAAAGHPLVGDSRYDRSADVWPQRLFLHCVRLELPVTESADSISLTAPLPDELKAYLKKIWGRL